MAENRNEELLEAILNAGTVNEVPQSRMEKIWQYALGATVELDTPQSRLETLAILVAEQVRNGGGTVDHTAEDGIIDHSISGNYVNDRVTVIGQYAFLGCSRLQSVSFPNVTTVGTNGLGSGSASTALRSLTAAHFPVIEEISTAAFRNASVLEAFVMNEITEVPTLANTNAFQGTPIESGTGYLYVPDSMVSSVQSESNWSAYSAQVKGMSDCPAAIKALFNIA